MSTRPAPAPPPEAADLSRRLFLADTGRAVAGAGLARYLPWVGAFAACARDDAGRGASFQTFTAAEGRTFRAVAAQILPSDDGLPGAEEAGAAHFADRALGAFFATKLPTIRAGLADLDDRARQTDAGARFAELSEERQLAVLRAVEHTPFFRDARMLVVTGTFADPGYGGNHGGAGWRLLDVEQRPMYEAPYGWYDAEAARAPRVLPGVLPRAVPQALPQPKPRPVA